jgi:hypothetical protein
MADDEGWLSVEVGDVEGSMCVGGGCCDDGAVSGVDDDGEYGGDGGDCKCPC